MAVYKSDCPVVLSGTADCHYVSNPYINFGGAQYGADRCLIDRLTGEAVNTFGFDVDYIVTTFDGNYDPVFKEDPTKRMVRKFSTRMKYDLQSRTKSYAKFGLEIENVVTAIVSKESFKYSLGFYDSVKWWQNMGMTQQQVESLGLLNQSMPKAGDLCYFRDDDTYYEIVDVDDRQGEGELNYGYAPAWYVYLKVAKDEHLAYISTEARDSLNDGIGNTFPVSGVNTITQNDMAIQDFFDVRKKTQEELGQRGVEYVETELSLPPDEQFKPFDRATDALSKSNGKSDKTEEEYLSDIGWN